VTQRDYYEVLGVARDVDAATLKKAYRKLALQYHPDRNDDAGAAVQFKEATEAYGVLSDENKRARYDMGGHAAVSGAGGFDPSQFSDFADLFSVFSDLFGAGPPGGAGGPRRTRPQRGDDLLYELVLPFREAALGAEKELVIGRLNPCAACDGSGAEAGTGRTGCEDCKGAGQVVVRQGFFTMSRTCPKCRGAGTVLEHPCAACQGDGRVKGEKRLKIRVPAGIADGQRIRVGGEGESGAMGGPAGDLYVHIRVEKHEYFWREGFDLHVPIPLAFVQVALGARIEVPTLDGTLPLEIPAGTEAGEIIRLKGKGIRRLSGSGHGDLLVHVRVRTPKRLTDGQKTLLRAYADSLDESYDLREEKSILEKVKDMFA
jgi:molecular chaperone DnaJ